MKTDRDLNATNQLIKVIRGEAFSIPQKGLPKKEESVVVHDSYAGWWKWSKVAVLSLIICMIFFTFLSVSFLSRDIKNLNATKDRLMNLQQQTEIPPEPNALWEEKEKLADRIDALSAYLSDFPRPYVSSIIKEISNVFPRNCFLNRLHVFIPSQEFSDHGTSVTIEATYIDNTLYEGADLSKVMKSIERSPIFAQVRVGYQDRSTLFNYRAIHFKLDFSLE